MSVPIDRLYNFLYDIASCNDIIIYQFLPHGSRKLEDLKDTFTIDLGSSWVKFMTTPCMIMHDQEPLMHNLYTKQDFKDHLERKKGKNFYPDCLLDFITDLHLRACITTQNNAYDQTLLCHSEQNSQDLELYEQHGFIGVYYWSHALIARDWYRYAELDPKLAPRFENIAYDFLIYNRAWSGTREYRLCLAELLANENLIPYCKMSFSEFDNELSYDQHRFVNPDFAITRKDLHRLYPPNVHGASASADYDNEDYSVTAIEVVLETLFDDGRHHLTEKTLRPIACGRPFILASAPGSLQYLKQYGFKTFDGLIDETYDTIEDPRERLEAIVKVMQQISALPSNEKQLLWSKLYAIADYNKKLFFSSDWLNQIAQEFKDNFYSALSRLTVGRLQHELDQIALRDAEMMAWRTVDKSPWGGPTLDERKELALWIQQRRS